MNRLNWRFYCKNLKWGMSSNLLGILLRPACKTWFFERRLMPDCRYVEIKPDYSDLEERMYEKLISPLVLQRCFEHTGSLKLFQFLFRKNTYLAHRTQRL